MEIKPLDDYVLVRAEEEPWTREEDDAGMCAGIVLAVGPEADGDLVGKRVIFYGGSGRRADPVDPSVLILMAGELCAVLE